MIRLFINGEQYEVEVEEDTPLLWVLRDHIGLTGTKYSCGIGKCGSCIVHIDGKAIKSCVIPISTLEGKAITTIEGISKSDKLHPVQQAWLDFDVSECGYCQPAQIMTAIALLNNRPNPSKNEINQVMNQVLCRCGSYQRISMAIQKVISSNLDKDV